RRDSAAFQQRRPHFFAAEPAHVAQDRSAVEQRRSKGLTEAGFGAFIQCAERSDREHPRRAIDRVRPAEEVRSARTHPLLKTLHSVLGFDQFAAYWRIQSRSG